MHYQKARHTIPHTEKGKENIRKAINKWIIENPNWKETLREKMKKIRQGKDNPNWKGGKGDHFGKLARKTLEKNGTNLQGLVVHHKNKNRGNNNLENLQAMTRSEHSSLHNPKGIKFGFKT